MLKNLPKKEEPPFTANTVVCVCVCGSQQKLAGLVCHEAA